jgi:hypothetical protein
MNPKVTLRGHWGPQRVGFLLMGILFGINIWRTQGPVTVLVTVLAGLSVAVIGVMIERRWLRRSTR